MSTTPSRRKTDSKAAKPIPAPLALEPSPSDIARRAFEIYCGRGYQPGHELDDWLQAECELRAATAATRATARPRRKRAPAES
jgi:hypothetical protein